MYQINKPETKNNNSVTINVTYNYNYGNIHNHNAPELKKTKSIFSKIGAFLSIAYKLFPYLKPLLGFFVIGI